MDPQTVNSCGGILVHNVVPMCTRMQCRENRCNVVPLVITNSQKSIQESSLRKSLTKRCNRYSHLRNKAISLNCYLKTILTDIRIGATSRPQFWTALTRWFDTQSNHSFQDIFASAQQGEWAITCCPAVFPKGFLWLL